MMDPGLLRIRDDYTWPHVKPDIPYDDHGWFNEPRENTLRPYVGEHVKTVVELGSWLGKSTRWFCRSCPNATVVAIDHWLGGPEHQAGLEAHRLGTLYDTFISNCWEFRERLIPFRISTYFGIKLLRRAIEHVDLLYVDASHDAHSVYKDVLESVKAFPEARLVGDDWPFPEVQAGVRHAVEDLSKMGIKREILVPYDYCWVLQ